MFVFDKLLLSYKIDEFDEETFDVYVGSCDDNRSLRTENVDWWYHQHLGELLFLGIERCETHHCGTDC